jgi:outer membrane protein OmpA-like peptidoglycan-associated protein
MIPAEEFKGRQFVLPPRNVSPASVKREAPKPPFTDRSFHILFDFNKSFLVYQLSDWLLDNAITYIRGVNPRHVTVTGWAATDPVTVSGRRIAEEPGIARERAQVIAESLYRLGVPRERITVRWRTGAKPIDAEGTDGLPEPSRRRVDIDVQVSPSPGQPSR